MLEYETLDETVALEYDEGEVVADDMETLVDVDVGAEVGPYEEKLDW